MANPNTQPRDPIVQTGSAGTAGGSVKNASAGRVKSISGGGANFTSQRDMKSGYPVPDSPYGKG
jgi:hypothetical protein